MINYKELKNAINRECKEDKEVFLNDICHNINEVFTLELFYKIYGMVLVLFISIYTNISY